MISKCFLVATTITIAAAIPAAAGGLADVIVEADIVAPTVSGIDWDGFYAGAHVGYGASDFTNFDDGEDNENAWWGEANYGSDISGFLSGATIGFNFVRGSILYGLEGQLGLGVLDGSAIDSVAIAEYPGPADTGEETRPETTVEISSYGNIAGRVGYLNKNTLVYGKIGVGFMNAEIDWQDPGYFAGDDCCGISNASDSLSLSGAVFGAGIEYALNDRMSLTAEYLRYAVGGGTVMPAEYDGSTDDFEQIVEIEDVDTVKFGINWRF